MTHTHRVVHKRHIRNEGRRRVIYEVGERITPNEAELEAFGDRFERLPEAEDEDDEDDEDGAGDAQSEETVEVTEDEDDEDEDGSAYMTPEWVEAAGYDELRGAAKDYEDVNGNWGEERLRAELAEKAT